ncbi:RNA-binding S4 domain-containing protein [Fimbriimonas ginsengisoli]|uniref:S4 domain protein YaaA n=1 Tax=Fimbriimonas ginsengisoli Gsoil 348 TaxID=661478 RepID=A0A068NK27_FIMGI|nr:RNA-binding S4 domain-containing protein [Fimbriimonas ginsengisoli]AIE83943.1 S4 domain protein YaaA [Fimbriimonas ginsengisoli Gsoil 348]
MPPQGAKQREIRITTEFITLGQLIKLLDLVNSGAEVKALLATARFAVNDEPDDRRGRKIYPGDIVTLPNQTRVKVISK